MNHEAPQNDPYATRYPHAGYTSAGSGYGETPPGWAQVPPYAYSPPAPARRGVGPLALALFGVITVSVAVITAFAASALHDDISPSAQQQAAMPMQRVDNTAIAGGTALQKAAQAVVPGLVYINTQLGYQSAAGAGTGIVLSSSGEVLTNNHVIAGATSITATDLGNGRTYPVTVVGYDRTSDVAVVKLTGASGLTTAPLGDSAGVRVGDQIVGVGNAGGGGGDPTAAPGRVTDLDQSITAGDESSGASEQLTGLIQIAANIQPGDSGGPLIDTAGKVVGMDTAASEGFRLGGESSGDTGQATASSGEGYAIPVATARSIAGRITAGQATSTIHIGDSAMLGVSAADADGGAGAAVQQVLADGAAAQVLSPGDIITALNGRPVTSVTALTDVIDTLHPGNTVSIRWLDSDGTPHTARVTLAKGAAG